MNGRKTKAIINNIVVFHQEWFFTFANEWQARSKGRIRFASNLVRLTCNSVHQRIKDMVLGAYLD